MNRQGQGRSRHGLCAMVFILCLGGLLPAAWASPPQNNPNTDWFSDAQVGVFMHFLPSDARAFAQVNDFDVDALAGQLEAVGAKYLVLTLGQNSGFMNSPNPT
ncbi:MAG: hypothetical protein GY809_09285, partial [Planctomycetes bacterium]|nr:hypothetical protein [Planctomycetota bacterium]